MGCYQRNASSEPCPNLPIARERIRSRLKLRGVAVDADAASRCSGEKGDDPGLRCLSYPALSSRGPVGR